MMKINKVAWLFLLALGLVLQGCSNSDAGNQVEKNDDKQVEAESETFDKTEVSEVKEDMLDDEESAVVTIQLKGDTAQIDGVDVESFDYTWHTDPSHEEEWYEGTEPQTEAAAYIAHDIWYYPTLDTDGFTLENYDGENEWVYHYTADGLTDYIYSTLPYQGEEVPVEMMHTAEEAYACPVLHITKPGTYSLHGNWKGQIFVDLGDKDDTFTDEKAKVTIVLNGVDVECTCAPAFIAYSAYECDNMWEEQESWSNEVDTANAGVRVVLADGSVNSFKGTNIFRLLKPIYKKEGSTVQKKSHKIDGAFYSFVSMNIDGEDEGSGILNIRSSFEGLDDELHLTINGGYINIYAENDGINVNEDKVSVFTMNGGTLHIFAGLGVEGDVVDSNGYIVVNGGLIAGGTPSMSDEILDSDCGVTENGGEVINIGASRGNGMGPGGFGGQMRPDGQPPEGMPERNDENGQRPEGMPERNDENGQHPEGMPEWKDNNGQPPEGTPGQNLNGTITNP